MWKKAVPGEMHLGPKSTFSIIFVLTELSVDPIGFVIFFLSTDPKRSN